MSAFILNPSLTLKQVTMSSGIDIELWMLDGKTLLLAVNMNYEDMTLEAVELGLGSKGFRNGLTETGGTVLPSPGALFPIWDWALHVPFGKGQESHGKVTGITYLGARDLSKGALQYPYVFSRNIANGVGAIGDIVSTVEESIAPVPTKKCRVPTAAPPAKLRAAEEDSEDEESVAPVPTKKCCVAIAALPAKSRVVEEDTEEEESIAPVPMKKCHIHIAPLPAEEKQDKVGKMSGSGMKVPNDQGGLTGALGKKRKCDEAKCKNNT
ncbi:hypothetical protein BT96DRAFT_949277 [Gymnopus androsaceus JB14]|uniref:Uncharacterized protein n=1 Tax=Gymnopus androsaceus JB14 TaxID=1447944 RepID=A0A6A4GKG2_9AGAR|nr:hypothetical protein BT96DRAFT_949277 [Gymnopus androsaceus JB14]